jgi:predicted RNase H-like HicB family nuclease
MIYPVIVHKDATSDYGGTVPDFPGCFTAAATLEELIANVQEAIECYMDGEEMEPPTPTSLAEVVSSEDAKGGAVILVPVDMSFLDRKAVPVNITMPVYVRNKIDRAAKASGKTRSAYMVECALRCSESTCDSHAGA